MSAAAFLYSSRVCLTATLHHKCAALPRGALSTAAIRVTSSATENQKRIPTTPQSVLCRHSKTAPIELGKQLALEESADTCKYYNTYNSGGGPTSGIFKNTRTLLEKSKRYKHLNPLTPDNAVNPLGKPLELNKSALHVVSSPLGNVKDFTIRALEVLRQCDYIVCTNRNATKALMNIIDIDFAGRLIQLANDQPKVTNKQEAREVALSGAAGSSSSASSSSPHFPSSSSFSTSSDSSLGVGVSMQRIVDMLRGGRSVALVTPAGTPCIADNGTELVKACILNGVRVVSVPGACAVTASLSISGANIQNNSMLATSPTIGGTTGAGGITGALVDGVVTNPVGATAFGEGSFFFGGYLSEKPGPRARQLRQVRDFSCPCVFFEVPRRLTATLTDMAAIFDRKVGDSSRNTSADDEVMVEAFSRNDVSSSDGNDDDEAAVDEIIRLRDRSHRKPRRVTVLHEITKFNESSHSGSSSALLRFYSQMGRSSLLTELGQLTIIVDGVATSDLLFEEDAQLRDAKKILEQRRRRRRGKGIRKEEGVGAVGFVSSASDFNSSTVSGSSSSFFKSSIFGGGIGDDISLIGDLNAATSSFSSAAENKQDQQRKKLLKKQRRQEKLRRIRDRLLEQIKAKQARLEARAIVERETVRREVEGPDGPTPLP